MTLAHRLLHAIFHLGRKRSPLLRDPQYAGLHALEADMRRKHMPVAKVTKAKQERLHQLLAGRA